MYIKKIKNKSEEQHHLNYHHDIFRIINKKHNINENDNGKTENKENNFSLKTIEHRHINMNKLTHNIGRCTFYGIQFWKARPFTLQELKSSRELNNNSISLPSIDQLQKKLVQKKYDHQTTGLRILRCKETENGIK